MYFLFFNRKCYKILKHFFTFVVFHIEIILNAMKIKLLFYILLCILTLTACKDKKTYVLEGDIDGLTNPAIYFVTSFDNETRIDTIYAKEGKFKFVSSFDSLKPVIIYMEDQSVWITIWAQNGEKIQLSGNVDYPELIEANGNEVNDLLTEFKQKNKDVIKERCDLNDLIKSGDESHSQQKSDLEQTLVKNAGDFIKEHPASIAGLVLIQDYLIENEEPDVLGDYLSLVESPAREDHLFTRLNVVSNRLQQTSVGNTAPDFSLVDTKGDTLTLESFKNQYFLLAFESSTCEACNEDYPVLESIRKEYASKDVAILSIAFDEDSSMWEKIAKEYTINWLQVIDKQGLASPLLPLYNVNTIPDYFLMDKEGKIIAAHATLNDIQQKLRELKTKN
jgi:peroxiredoxin